MSSFRYQAIGGNGGPVSGVIEAEDRKGALQLLGSRGLFPSKLELAPSSSAPGRNGAKSLTVGAAAGRRITRKEITAFTREMSALLGAAIPIPQALDGLAEEENPSLHDVVVRISESVRKGASFSAALEEHPAIFSTLYVSMIRVGEEAGVLPKVMSDLADLLEHEDEVRSEVVSAVAYPLFVLAFGLVTVTVLLTWVMPRLFGMLQEMLQVLPLPTLILLKLSSFMHRYWIGVGAAIAAAAWACWSYFRTPDGAE